MSRSDQIVPNVREDGLILRDLDDEVLVYDQERDKALCLNQTVALVWKNCNGKRSIAEIAQRMQAELKAPVETNVVWYAIEQLDKYHLLRDSIPLPDELVTMSRRDFLKKVGIATAVAVPAILSITLPTPAQAASCLPSGAMCSGNGQCCSGVCMAGVCA